MCKSFKILLLVSFMITVLSHICCVCEKVKGDTFGVRMCTTPAICYFCVRLSEDMSKNVKKKDVTFST
jgi:hypothetical protein